MMNKEGSFMGIMLIVGVLMLIIMAGVLLIIGSSVINWIADETIPVLNDIGVVDNTNFTQITEITINPINTVIQNFTWVASIMYIFGIIGVFGLAFMFRGSGDKWLIGLFFACVLILVICSIFMSNIYEEIYAGNDDFTLIIREHLLLSYLILYSPAIMTLVAFIAGVIMFSGPPEGGL